MSDIERARLLVASLRRLGQSANVEIVFGTAFVTIAGRICELDAADELAERLALAEVEKLRAELGLAG